MNTRIVLPIEVASIEYFFSALDISAKQSYNTIKVIMELFNDFLNSAKKLIAIDSVESDPSENAPFGKGVAMCLSETLCIAKSLGFNIVDGDGYYGYADIGEGQDLFGILGHLDVVPYDDTWSVPPLSGNIVDGYMYGRGMQDDKVPTLMCLYAVAELIQSGLKPTKRIRVIFGCNEESGWKCMDRYIEREELPTMGFTPDSDFPVINCEKGVAHYSVRLIAPKGVTVFNGGERANMVMDYCKLTLDELDEKTREIAQKSGLIVENNTIIATGRSAHGSTPHKGDSALNKIVKALADSHGGEWQRLFDIIAPTDGSGMGIAESDSVSGALTTNIGTVRLVDGEIVFDIDVRYPINGDRDKIREKMQKSFGNSSKIDINFYHDPLYVPKDSALVYALLSAYNEITGDTAQPISIGGATYARAMPSGTCVAFGPIFPDEESTIHGRDERASIESMRKAYQVYLKAIKNICFK